ncbi:MAG: hypothetical protein AMXMBFR33_14970 [Candidatus Xenobia bacterium]
MVLLALGWLLADQGSKWLVQSHLKLHESQTTPGDWLLWTHVHNRGGAFGLFPGASLLFLGTGVGVIAVLLWTLPRTRSLDWASAVAYGLIMGGALGNLLDRLRLGYVVDFIDLNFRPLVTWPVFNVADIGISTGIGLLILTSIWPSRSPRPAPESSSTHTESSE